MINIFQYRNGLRLLPATSLTLSAKGELQVLDSDGKLYYHNGTTSAPVVTSSQGATLTNVIINADLNIITNIDNNDIKALAAIDATKIANGSVSNTEFQYLDGVTSPIQDQLDPVTGNLATKQLDNLLNVNLNAPLKTSDIPSGTGTTNSVTITTGDADFTFGSGQNQSGTLNLKTGDINDDTNASGNINIQTGSNTSGSRGNVDLTGHDVSLTSIASMTVTSGGSGIGLISGGTINLLATTDINMFSPVDMNTTNKIINLANPTLAQDAATKAYVDSLTGGSVTRTSVDQGANRLQNKDLDDDSVKFVDSGDTTKTLEFETSGSTTGTTTTLATTSTTSKTLTLPNITDTLITRTSTDQGANRLQNKDLSANNVVFVDSADTTKKIVFSAASNTSGAITNIESVSSSTRSIVLPNASTTLVGTDATQSITNKDLNGGTASADNKWAIPKNTKANLNLLARREGNLFFATDEDTVYVDNGITLVSVAAGGIPTSQVVAEGGNNTGSTNDVIRRFTSSTTSGTAITYADSATLGGTFTINEGGAYVMSYTDVGSAGEGFGISINSSQLTTSINAITASDRLNVQYISNNSFPGNIGAPFICSPGDIIRAHVASATSGFTTDARTKFIITKVSI